MSHPPRITLVHCSALKKHSYKEFSVLTCSAFSSAVLSGFSSLFLLSWRLPNPVVNSQTYCVISEAFDSQSLPPSWTSSTLLGSSHYSAPVPAQFTLSSLLILQIPGCFSPWSTAPSACTSKVISSNFMNSCSSIHLYPDYSTLTSTAWPCS